MDEGLFSNQYQWFWSIFQGVATLVITGLIAYFQIKLQRQANRLNTVFALSTRWNSREMEVSRVIACSGYDYKKRRTSEEDWQVASFFEELGLHLERGDLDEETVSTYYSYYIRVFWAMLKGNIEELRRESQDATRYAKFEWLEKQMRRILQERGSTAAEISDEEIRKVCEVEAP